MQKLSPQIFSFDEFTLDLSRSCLLREGCEVQLRPKSFEALKYLVENPGRLVEKAELIKAIWPDTSVTDDSLVQCLIDVRRALGDDSHSYIKTVPRRGYIFDAEVVEQSAGKQELVYTEEVEGITVAIQEESKESAALKAASAESSTGRILRRNLALAGLVVIVLAFASVWGYLHIFGGKAIDSIAVLPLDNLSDPDQDYFADGMTDALITELGRVGALRVISRTSMMNYKGARKTIPEIARELGVDAVVEGSVMRSGERIGITVNLIETATDQHLWGERYERDLRDTLSLHSEIARRIASEIRVKLTPQEQAHLTNARPINPDAYEAYLKGRFLRYQAVNKANSEEITEQLEKSFGYFEQAIDIDPNYAEAYAGLAQAYHWLGSARPVPQFREFYSKAKAAALKAIELDETLADAHGALAFTLHRLDYDWSGAEREYRRTIELDPNSGYRHGYGLYLSNVGRLQEAIAEMKRAVEIDPHTLPNRVSLGTAYLHAREYDNAIKQYRNCLDLAPNYHALHSMIGEAYIFKGMYEEGTAEIQKYVNLTGSKDRLPLAWAYAMSGKRDQAIKILDDLGLYKQKPVENIGHRPIAYAAVYAALGDRDRAIGWLEKAYEMRLFLLHINSNPDYDSLRSDPRF